MNGMDKPTPPTRSRPPLILPLLILTVTGFLLFRHGQTWLRRLLSYLAHAAWARRIVSGWSVSWRVASRFVAGTDREAAVATTRAMNERGLLVTLDYLGESCTCEEEALEARDEILRLLDDINRHGLRANVSVKPTQLGLKVDPELALNTLCTLVERANQVGNFIRVDMEDSPTTDATLAMYRRLRYDAGLDNVGVVIQSYLYRSEDDIERLIADGARVRLCKGAYAEPAEVAYPHKADVDANYLNLSRLLLSDRARANGVYPAFATHDPRMIDEIKRTVATRAIPRDAFEFQMLYGIRRDLQEELVADGYQMRVYVPYGTAWYPYFMRRLAERPANLWFFISNLVRA
ncbi:proline dehydrogenase family protein [Promineifilum sp.]|uniref:proline dehydrogenase family protein n=1 Tax=Promineifilum sp. TaxID=2664178 RepID=UPI0035B208F0